MEGATRTLSSATVILANPPTNRPVGGGVSESVATGTGVGVEASVDPTVGEIVEGGCEAALDSGAGLVHAATATAMAAASAQADERQGRTTSLRRPPRGPVTPTVGFRGPGRSGSSTTRTPRRIARAHRRWNADRHSRHHRGPVDRHVELADSKSSALAAAPAGRHRPGVCGRRLRTPRGEPRPDLARGALPAPNRRGNSDKRLKSGVGRGLLARPVVTQVTPAGGRAARGRRAVDKKGLREVRSTNG